MRQIIVSLSSFGASEVKRHGQGWFTRLCAAAGADGVEIRGELLQEQDGEIDSLAALLRGEGLDCVYSSPEMLWDRGGALDRGGLNTGLDRAQTLGAPVLKMSIGGFAPDSVQTLPELKACLAQRDIRLLIENDQTASAGTLTALRSFFQAVDGAGLELGMTFDMGNWHWVGECPIEAARTFAERVHYVHCKGVQHRTTGWVAVPLADSIAPWRALLRALPSEVPHAIEYPLMGESLLSVVRDALRQLRALESGL